jgi:hypothetical protein
MLTSQVLVSAFQSNGRGNLLLIDLNQGTYQPLLAYQGPFCTTAEHLFVTRLEGDRARLEKYDRSGLVWLRRLAHCYDAHSVALLGEEIAICSTGTNEIIYLDAEGSERRRHCVDGGAEPDSWHINSLTVHAGRLFATSFGRFERFREWATRLDGSGLLLDVDSGVVVREGLAAPHDPWRVAGGWLINDSARSRTLWCPDGGPAETVVAGSGFARGLAVIPGGYVIGFSSPRDMARPQHCAAVVVVEASSRQVVKAINLPYAEIGQIFPAPGPAVLDAVRREQAAAGLGLLPEREVITEADRAGAVVALGRLQPWKNAPRPEMYQVPVCIRNCGRAVWSSRNEIPVHLAYQIMNERGEVIVPDGARTALPLPLLPGQELTFTVTVDLSCCLALPMAAALRLTLVQEGVAWWQANDSWTPAVIPVPSHPLSRKARQWAARWKARWLPAAGQDAEVKSTLNQKQAPRE